MQLKANGLVQFIVGICAVSGLLPLFICLFIVLQLKKCKFCCFDLKKTKVKGSIFDKIESSGAFFDMYIGDGPVSEQTKTEIGENVANIMRRC